MRYRERDGPAIAPAPDSAAAAHFGKQVSAPSETGQVWGGSCRPHLRKTLFWIGRSEARRSRAGSANPAKRRI